MNVSRPFAEPDDLPRLCRFLVDVGRTAGPVNGCFHIGDLLWGRYMYEDSVFDPADRIRIWEGRDGEILGFAWLYPPATVEINIQPSHQEDPRLIGAMLDWAGERRRSPSSGDRPSALTICAFATDAVIASVLASRGFARNDHPAMLLFTRDLTEPIPTPVVPDGFAVRSLLGESEFEERVAIHREVWHPSRVTVAAYRRLRTAEGYHADLDLVAVAPDGTFAAYAILWHDEENRTGEFEPVGARPAYRGRGLTRAVLLEGLRRLRERDGQLAIVYTPESNAPARRLYESVGFRVVNRWVYWERPDRVCKRTSGATMSGKAVTCRVPREIQMVATRMLTADELLTMPGDYELIRGELREVSPSSAESTMVALNVGSPLHVFVGQHKLGVVTAADGGFNLFPDRRSVVAPDVGFIRRDRIPPGFDYQHYFPVPPDLAFEAVSPSDSFGDVMEKVELYLEAGVSLIWVAIPQRRVVVVYRPDRAPNTLTEKDELDGEDVVPGFRLPVRAVFANPLAE